MKNYFIVAIGCFSLFINIYKANCQVLQLDQMVKSKPFVMGGGLSIQGSYITQSNNSFLQTINPYNVVFTGNPVVSIYGLDIPLQFMWSPQSTSFQQPFNQFSVNPRYKWASIYMGYQNLSYNPYTLNGHTIYGYGFEFNPGKFKIGAVYGRFAKATSLDTITQTLQPVNFSRQGFAAHIGVGSAKTYFDISILKASDDSASLGKIDLKALSNQYVQYIEPGENIAVGINTRIAFSKHFYWEAIGGASIYTRDIRNQTIPDDSSALLTTLKKLITVNATTQYMKAYQTAIGITTRNFLIKFQYQYIDPNYMTMGAYSMNSDIQNFTVAPSIYLFKRKLSIVGSIGFQNDNLNKLKAQTSSRIISSVAVNANFNRHFNISGNYSNYNINMTPSLKTIADTVRITQNNKNFSFTPVYTHAGLLHTHTVVVSVMATNMNDFSNYYTQGEQFRTINTYIAFLNYSISFNKINTGIQTGINYNNTTGMGLSDNNAGVNLGFNKRLAKNKVIFAINGAYLTGKRNGNNTNITNGTVQFSFRVDKHHSFNINGNYNSTIIQQTGGDQQINYGRVNAGYSLQF